jgi:hypothetical protein
MQMILKSKKKQSLIKSFSISFSLKHEQNVLIDFSGFPSCLIDYLKHCIRDEHTDTVSNKYENKYLKTSIKFFSFSSRFQLQLVTEEGKSHHVETHLRVIEISKFNYLARR